MFSWLENFFATPVALRYIYLIVTYLKTYLCHFWPTSASCYCENSNSLILFISEVRNFVQVLSQNMFSWPNNWICCIAGRSFHLILMLVFNLFYFLTLNSLIEILPQPRKSQSSLYQQESHLSYHLKGLLYMQGCAEQGHRLLDPWTSLLPRKETKAWMNFLFLVSCIFVFCFDLRQMLSNHNFFRPGFASFLWEICAQCTSREFIHAFPELL